MFSTSLASCWKMRSAETSLCVSGAACVAAGAGVAGAAEAGEAVDAGVAAAGTGAVSAVGVAVVAEAGAAGVAGAAGSDCATAVIPKPSTAIKKQKLKKERMLPPSP